MAGELHHGMCLVKRRWLGFSHAVMSTEADDMVFWRLVSSSVLPTETQAVLDVYYKADQPNGFHFRTYYPLAEVREFFERPSTPPPKVSIEMLDEFHTYLDDWDREHQQVTDREMALMMCASVYHLQIIKQIPTDDYNGVCVEYLDGCDYVIEDLGPSHDRRTLSDR